MGTGSGEPSRLFSGVLSQREALIAQFEDAWFEGKHPTIDDYLPDDDALRAALLPELALVDLECRLNAGEAVRAESYLGRFPELANEPGRVVEVLLHEFHIRQQRETVSLDEFAVRFPQYVESMRQQMSASADSIRGPTTRSSRACDDQGKPFPKDARQTEVFPAESERVRALDVSATPGGDERPVDRGLVGRFQLLEVAGRGAFGTVWRARDGGLDRTVAVKIPSSGRLISADEENRFLREARSMAQLRHPGIVAVYESGRCDGVPYIVSEFIDGQPLDQALAARRFPVREAAELVRRVARALDYAHQQGVVHRDLKPSNIMLGSQTTHDSSLRFAHAAAPVELEYEPRVMDFGLALREHGEATMTVDGQIMGTAAYMSPEQARGESHQVDRRGDVYSVGVILYEMLAGEAPFRGNLRMVLEQVLHDDPSTIRRFNDQVPRDLETICLKCLEKEPRSRYQSAGELADELERFLTGLPIAARPVGAIERGWRWCRRHPTVASLAASVVLVFALGFAGVTWQWLATKQAEHSRTLAQVEALLEAAPSSIPTLLDSLAPYRAEVEPLLERRLSDDDLTKAQQLRARLGLLAGDTAQAEPLVAALFDVDMETFLVLRRQLLSSGVRVEEQLTQILTDDGEKPDRRFRAAGFLAASPLATNLDWAQHAPLIAEELLTRILENPNDYGVLTEAVRPVAKTLIEPLEDVFVDTNHSESARRTAANLLVDFAANEPPMLVKLALAAEPWQLSIVLAPLRERHPEAAGKIFEQFLQAPPEPGAGMDALDHWAKQRANAAIALAELGRPDSAWALLSASPDMSARSYFIHRYPQAAHNVGVLVDQLLNENDTAVRRAMILTLGSFPTSRLPADQLAAAKDSLWTAFEKGSDPGTHAAARWTLTQWHETDAVATIEREHVADNDTSAKPSWYVNSEGHTMMLLGPATFRMGSPPDEPRRYSDERLHEQAIDRRFAIAMCETTIGQFRRFDPRWRSEGNDPDESDAHPVHSVSWYRAAAYCNWLSGQEGIPRGQWCYVPDDIQHELLREADNSLARSGYRLPTEAEWEYACRAGTTTARFFGHSAELTREYAWSPVSSAEGKKHPVGLKKPNDFGLFDVYGNVDEICHDRNTEANLAVTRGGAAGDLEPPRSALRNNVFTDPKNPQQGGLALGFRIARTIDPSPPRQQDTP